MSPPPDGRISSGRAVVLATTVTVVTALPMFLVGALSVPLRTELAFGPAALGAAIAVFRGSGALAARPLGNVADRIGSARAMRYAVTMAAAGAAGIALLARSWWALAVGLALCGMSASFGQTAANRYLIRVVHQQRQGLAFGIKQAAMPTGSMLAGLMVPVIGLTLGWRAAFVTAALGTVLFLRALPRPRPNRPSSAGAERQESRSSRLALLVITVALMFGMGAASTLAGFTVESAVAAGFDVGTAALLLTAGSICAIVVRVVIGYVADRMVDGHLKVVAAMLGGGAAGYALLALGQGWALVIGAIIAFALGWGFNGLFWFAIVRLHRHAPAAISGRVMAGGMLGGVFGPLSFGWIVEQASFSTAWSVVAVAAAVASVLMRVGLAMMLRAR